MNQLQGINLPPKMFKAIMITFCVVLPIVLMIYALSCPFKAQPSLLVDHPDATR